MPYPNVREYVKITGTGDFPLAGALPSYERVGQQYNTNDTFHYRIDHTTENEWEEGTGTYNEATNVVARTTVTASSNSGNKVAFSAGTKIIEIGPRVQVPVHNSDPSGTREGELIYSNGTLKINDGSSLAEVGGGGGGDILIPYSTWFEDISSRYDTVTSGGTVTTDSTYGLKLTIAGTAEYCALQAKLASGFLLGGEGQYHAWAVRRNFNGGDADAFVGLTFFGAGSMVDATGTLHGSTDCVGFAYVGSTVYAVTNDGDATETSLGALGTSNHLAFTRSDGNIKFYVNGELAATHTTNVPTTLILPTYALSGAGVATAGTFSIGAYTMAYALTP